MTPSVAAAVEEIKAAYPRTHVRADGDGDGGAFVFVEEVPLSEAYQQSETWIGFHIVYLYPDADVYPHFVREDLSRVDGLPLTEGMSRGEFQGSPAIQLSRRSNRWDPARDTALLKLKKVISWLNHDT